jgi:hypothetical protein
VLPLLSNPRVIGGQVVEDIVKPATKDLQCRYVDLASVKASGAVGEAKVGRPAPHLSQKKLRMKQL